MMLTNNRRKLSFYGTAFTAFFLVVILVLTIAIADLRQIVSTNNKDQAGLITRLLVRNVNASLDDMVLGLERLCDLEAGEDASGADEIYKRIRRYEEKSLFERMGLVDGDLNVYGGDSIDEDFITRLGVRNIFDANATCITEPYRSPVTADMVFTVFSPVRAGGAVKYLIYGTFALDHIQDFADVEDMGVSADIYLTDSMSYNMITCRTDDTTSSGSWGSLLFDLGSMTFEEEDGYNGFTDALRRGDESILTGFTMDDVRYTQCCERIHNMEGWYLTVRISDVNLGSSQAGFRQRLILYAFMIGAITLLFMAGIAIRLLRQKRRFEAMSVTDTMTGLLNKKTFEARVGEYIGRSNSVGTLVFVDVDDFKNYNDSYGHQNGDRVLKKIASELIEQFGTQSFIGRYGGDEFIVFIRDCADREKIKQSFDIMRDELSRTELDGYGQVHVGFSAGAAIFPTDAENYTKLCKAADEALYDVKKGGKERLYFCKGYSRI